MKKRRGFSLVEVLVTTILSSVVLGILISMFAMISRRAEEAVAKTTAINQAKNVIQVIEPHIRNATHIQVGTLATGPYLRCTLAQSTSDIDQDGKPDVYRLSSVGNNGRAKYGRGQRVTYYMSDSSGGPTAAASGRWLWRGWRNDNAAVTLADIDGRFAKYYSRNTSIWNLVQNVNYVHNETEATVTVSVTSRVPTANNTGRTVTFTRTIPYLKGEF